MSEWDDIFSRLSGKRSQYSADEIEEARKKAKKTGGNFLDTLQSMTGRQMPVLDDALSVDSLKANSDAITGEIEKLTQDLNSLNRNLERDFGIGSIEAKEPQKPVGSIDGDQPKAALSGIEAFEGIENAVGGIVFGQDLLIKKLTVAFKRPFVLKEEEKHARNCFLITGPENTGKHLALSAIANELGGHGVLSGGDVCYMDLSIYTAAGKDNVFLQDLYIALVSKAQVIAFERFEECHVSYLTYIRDLVMNGECRLQDRYTLKQGQLVNVSNSFAAEAVGSFSAEGKYLAFISTKGVDNLANVMGAPFVNALGDVCTSQKLDDETIRKIAVVQIERLREKAKTQLSFGLEGDIDSVTEAAAASVGKNGDAGKILEFCGKLLKSLATMKLEGSYAPDTRVELRSEESKLYAVIGEEKTPLMDNLPVAYTGEIEAVKAELANIVGLSAIKEYILSLEEYYNTQKRRREAGLKASEVSKHMIFTGNPGTGKTTIARIVSRYLKAIGVLSGGQLVEVSRADLVGRYVGHTAPLVNQVLQSAMGGVLFIDEAYSLYRGQDDSFGLEAIDTLVKGIEDNRDNLIVILAGYSNEMQEFLESNSGLKSRFPNLIDFPDYSGEELLQITKITVKSKGYVLDEGMDAVLLAYYNAVQALCADTAGNGRLVRNKVEEAILNQSRRLAAEPDADLSVLTSRDFELNDI